MDQLFVFLLALHEILISKLCCPLSTASFKAGFLLYIGVVIMGTVVLISIGVVSGGTHPFGTVMESQLISAFLIADYAVVKAHLGADFLAA